MTTSDAGAADPSTAHSSAGHPGTGGPDDGAGAGNAYQALAATLDDDEGRWAFGTGFADAFVAAAAEITAPVPAAACAEDVATYCLMLGDDALIASQRLAEWVTRAPELEEEVALANIALDLLGQARILLARAGHLGAAEPFRPAPVSGEGHPSPALLSDGALRSEPAGGPPVGEGHPSPALLSDGALRSEHGPRGPSDEDVLAYFRDEHAFRNVALVESDGGPAAVGDFAQTIAWLLVLSSWRLGLMARLVGSADPMISALAERAVPELSYHRDYAVQWVLRLGDGTEYSHGRMQAGLDAVWPFVEELFRAHDLELRLADAGVAVDPAEVRGDLDAVLDQVLPPATLSRPERAPVGQVAVPRLNGPSDGRAGVHTEALGPVLAVMQSLARAHPGATW